MRRSFFPALVTLIGLVAAGCGEDRSSPSSPLSPAFAVSTTATLADVQLQSDALLTEPARTAARYALAKVQSDIVFKRSTLYASSLAYAAIPLIERRLNHIPQDKVGQLVQLLCSLSSVIKPYLPPSLAAIDFCRVDPAHLTDDAAFQLVTNTTGATLTTGTKKFSLDITAASMNVGAVLITVLPLSRTATTTSTAGALALSDPHPCPSPWDAAYARYDCYPEYYEVSVQPAVAFTPTAALEVCQIDPSASVAQTPTSAVEARLKLFSKDGLNKVSVLGQGSGSPADAVADCSSIEHATAIGPVGFTKWGMHNALARLGRFSADALSLFRPTPLFASNSPTHGDVSLEFSALVGFVVGALDPVVRVASVQVSPSPASISVGGTVTMSRQILDKVGGVISEPSSLQGTTWSSSNLPSPRWMPRPE